MKRFILILICFVAYNVCYGYDNEVLLKNIKLTEVVVKNEIKTLKSQIKLYPNDSTYTNKLNERESYLSQLKAQEGIVKKTIAADKKQVKAKSAYDKALDQYINLQGQTNWIAKHHGLKD